MELINRYTIQPKIREDIVTIETNNGNNVKYSVQVWTSTNQINSITKEPNGYEPSKYEDNEIRKYIIAEYNKGIFA